MTSAAGSKLGSYDIISAIGAAGMEKHGKGWTPALAAPQPSTSEGLEQRRPVKYDAVSGPYPQLLKRTH